MDNLLRKLLLGGSTAAMFAGVPIAAVAQNQSSDIEQVVVSASRIAIAGYNQPTPVTVVGAAQLLEAANADIGDTIRQMPEVGNSSSPQKGSNGGSIFSPTSGLSTVNLRNLGVTRTLVLFDGQRVVWSNTAGGVDLGIIPTALVQRVDVVTGGASAAWGSDAVAGVVNLVLNKNFTGLKTNLEFSDTGNDARRAYDMSATFGFDAFGGRAHFIISGDYSDSPQTVFVGQEHWYNASWLMQNPAYTATNGQVRYLTYRNVGMAATPGGAILSGPLAGIQFGANGQISTYNPGLVTGSMAVGGNSNFYNSEEPIDLVSYPYHSTTFFAYGSYKITSDIQASLQLNYGNTHVMSGGTTAYTSPAVIKTDNAYLPASIAARMAAVGATSFTLSSTETNNVDLSNPSWAAFQKSIGIPVDIVNRQLLRGVLSLDGAISDTWSWNAYYQHGESRTHAEPPHIVVLSNLVNSIDAVTVTSGNVAKSGLAIGSVACRSTLANPANGCVPVDIFGTGTVTQGAVNYINTDQDYEILVLNEDVASASVQGTLPWDIFGAGAPAVSFGGEYRKEGAVSDISPLAAAGALAAGNFGSIRGQYNVEEGFLEVNAPIIKNGFVDSFDLNAAGRITSYSTSGLVETWKLGATSQINDDIRLRATYSFDIRAPDLAELFQGSLFATTSPTDPKTGSPALGVLSNTVGNPNLLPEEAFTVSGGVVLTPHWTPGLSISFDWYSINVHGFITAPSANIETQLCEQGQSHYCSQFIYDGSTLKQLILSPQNAASLTTSGLDFAADYAMSLFSGNMAWHLVGNYTDEETESAFGSTAFDYAGSLGGDSQYSGSPKLHFNLSAAYTEGPWTGTAQARYIGSGKLNNAWTSGVQVDNNQVPQVVYFDLRGTYRWNDNLQLYAAMDNVFDTPPPTIPEEGTESNPYQNINTRSDIYDTLGRTFRVGIRLTY